MVSLIFSGDVIEKMQIYPNWKRHLVAKSSTTLGQIYICVLISCLTVVDVSHTLEYEYVI